MAPIIVESVNYSVARNQVFNVGVDVPFIVNRFAKVIADFLGREPKVKHLPARNEVMLAFSDHSKAERIFGKRFKTSLEEGIGLMAEWVKAYGTRESSIFENIEIMKNLPPSWAAVVKK